MQFESIEICVTLDIVQKSLLMVQFLFFSDFGANVPKYILENTESNMF